MAILKAGLAVVGIPTALITIAHINSLPFSYTIRSWWLLRALVKRAQRLNLEPEPLFTIVSQSQRCLWDDIDYNQHMVNSFSKVDHQFAKLLFIKSTYNKKLDFSRIHLLYVVLPRIMMEPNHHIFAHNAGVFTLFKEEIQPLQPYTIQTRIWTWNEKWLFLQHRFIITKADGSITVCCLAISKIVFKLVSGKTVSPKEIFQICGHDDTIRDKQVQEKRQKQWEKAKHLLSIQHDENDWKNEPIELSKL